VRVITHTPDKTAAYENLVKMEYQRQCGDMRFGDSEMLEMIVTAYHNIPKSVSRKKRTSMELGEIRPAKKPDVDNVLKVIADSLNHLAYRDDSQIVDARVRKYYALKPRVEVSIKVVGG